MKKFKVQLTQNERETVYTHIQRKEYITKVVNALILLT